jgi:hypothetical protein
MLLAGLGERNELYIALLQEWRTSSAEVNLNSQRFGAMGWTVENPNDPKPQR